jgi:5-methylcytosine-specific restriction endonuclease McrA
MAFNIVTMSRVASPLTQAERLKVLERDHYCCRYCGLDGRASFENALVLSVDFVLPRAHKGKKDASNLVACCRACNMIKGVRVYKSFEDAKRLVLARREELWRNWEARFGHHAHPVELPELHPDLCAGL